MDVFEAVRTRRSVRRFKNKAVEDEKLRAILEAARQAPSWANRQCWRFIVVKDRSVIQKVGRLLAPPGYNSNRAERGLTVAPVVIAACADPDQSGNLLGQPYYMTDVGIAAQNLMLAVRALGLGTVFIGLFDEVKLRSLLEIPSAIRIVGLFPIGYPQEEKTEGPPRKPLEEIVFYEKWKK